MSARVPEGPGLARRDVRVADRDMVVVRSVVEAYDGLACYFGDGSGQITLLCPVDRVAELDALLEDLRTEGLALF